MTISPTCGQKTPEHVRQAWLDRFLDKVVLSPCEIRGIDQANKSKESIGSRMMAIGRGCKSGTPDHWVFQDARVLPIEIKHNTAPSDAQKGTATSLERCGFHVVRECRTTYDALNGLRIAGFRLHGNADNLAREYQERMEAGLVALELRKGTPRKAARSPSKPRFSARDRRVARVYAETLPK